MTTCDEDFDEMQHRKGGPGAGVIVWGVVLILAALALLLTLGIGCLVFHDWQHDHPQRTEQTR